MSVVGFGEQETVRKKKKKLLVIISINLISDENWMNFG